MRATFLVDNGSLDPAAILSLRRLAAALEEKTGGRVQPVSLLHSDKVDERLLDNRRARVLETALSDAERKGITEILLLPLFIGPSLAVTDYMPRKASEFCRAHPETAVRIGSWLFDVNTIPTDFRLSEILRSGVETMIREKALDNPAVILVDHGSPVPAVTEVRNYLAGQLGVLLRDRVKGVRPASMERRPGKPYGFNEPLLEKQLREPGYNCGDVVVAMAFLQPGRHAGADGDVASICRHAEEQQSGLTAHMTPLIGDHPLLLDILKDKWEEGWSREPVS